MAKYRVKPGRTFGAGGKFPAGSVVELDPADAKGFWDLLIPLDGQPEKTPLKNELHVVLESDLTQSLVEETVPDDEGQADEAEGMIDLAGTHEKKTRKRKKAE